MIGSSGGLEALRVRRPQNLPRYNFENSISASDPVKNKGAGAKKEKNVTNSDTKERGCGF